MEEILKFVHDIVTAINTNKVKAGEEKIKYGVVVDFIKERYPDIEISKSPWKTPLEADIAAEILKEFVPVISDPDADLQEHLYMQFPHSGIFVMPVNLDGTSGRWVDVKTSKAATTDLADCRMLNPKNKLSDYAKWLKDNYKAKEIDYKGFKELGFRVIHGYRPTDDREPPVKLVEPSDINQE